LQDLENSARSQAKKKIKTVTFVSDLRISALSDTNASSQSLHGDKVKLLLDVLQKDRPAREKDA